MRLCFALLVVASCTTVCFADDHQHAPTSTPAPPTVFLDKSPRIVEYQLKRLDNTRLLMVPRKTDDAKYIPVYSAILARVGMSPQLRGEAVDALVALEKSSFASVLLDAITRVDGDERAVRRTRRELARMLLEHSPNDLVAHTDELTEATKADDSFIRSVGLASLVVAGNSSAAMERAESDNDATVSMLRAVDLLSDSKLRDSIRTFVARCLDDSTSVQVRGAAIDALGHISSDQSDTFQRVASLITDDKLRGSAVKTLLKVGDEHRDLATSQKLLADLVAVAEATPAADRTSGEFTDAMQLADRLMASASADDARQFRDRLSNVSVRMIRIKTVEEEMRYDIAYFAVEAGRPVQVVLENHDLMPHNLVICDPGTLKEVAQLGLEAGPTGGSTGLPYVPSSDRVIEATEMIAANGEARLTFTAPTEPGEYPYVCTFPQHWYRMYGVMVVVEDLDAWLKNPTEPANPIGSNRVFVQSWTLNDFKVDLDQAMVGRTPEFGKRIFAEASCAGCHKVAGEGGVVGPELTDVFPRWKGDRLGILREILDPSHKIDAKYVMQRVLTVDGRTISGVLVGEDDDSVSLMPSAEAKEPTVIAQDDIEAMVPSSVSMMPKALMDQYTKEEIFELMSYLESVAPNNGS
ncbi:Auracyanin-A precursor [Rubripirellula tenax]|uniref:Auracyanin-A n=1 Tax=Rubripirellula tenax TaxID=2528015 RepID=A0A5C6FFT7_9BACT|nr:c-type cytochrome [Rubripirellula tenax]TWU59084.1 Auracyanin-A precursor [Rubripirellula tenax]